MQNKKFGTAYGISKALKRKPHLMVGVLGCMAERLKSGLLEKEQLVDLVVGPDAYRDLPQLLSRADDGEKAVNVLLSREETYAELSPIRLNSMGLQRLFPLCGAVTTCARSAWFLLREAAREPRSR
jgi:tRNA-2-methylthio-N6-dimethylallyladenosine synthase